MHNSDTKKIKICHIANTDKAVRFLLLPQLEFLKNKGYDVYAVCSEGKWVKYIEEKGIKVKTIKMKRRISPFSDMVALAKLFFYFKKEKFNIVHTHNPKPSLLGQLAAKLAGTPIIINTIHGLYFQNSSSFFKRRFFIFLEKIAAKCSNLIFSQNQEDIQTLIKENIAKEEIIKYLGNGVDIEKFNSERLSKDDIDKKKEELGIPKEFQVIGIVARLVEEKGYLDLFEAFKAVLKEFPKTILLAIGPEEPEKKDALNPKTAEKYKIENNVLFLGERADLDLIYPLMDIFVLPSYREGLSRSILEAMAERRPIITSDIRGCREEIESGRSGILIPAGDPKRLSETIIFLLNNKEKSAELGKNARLRAEELFNEKAVFNKIEEEYENLLDNNGRN